MRLKKKNVFNLSKGGKIPKKSPTDFQIWINVWAKQQLFSHLQEVNYEALFQETDVEHCSRFTSETEFHYGKKINKSTK